MNYSARNTQVLKKKSLEVQGVIREFKNKNLDPETFCIMPFVNIILEPTGSVGLCRHKGTEFSLGNIKENTISEILNGEKARKWRREFIEGKPQICKVELKHRKCNLCPELNKMLPHTPIEETPEKYIRLTANFNGFCNLECQMCHIWKMPNGLYDEINFWQPAKLDVFPFLKEIDMLSGEPFLQKDTYRLIDEVTSVNNDCLWTFTTNAHWKLNSKIKNSLDKINIKNIILSVDSLIPNTYAKIRKNGNLSIVLDNIQKLREYEQERLKNGLSALNMHLHFLTQPDNWKELQSIIDYCIKNNIHPFISFCYEPYQHSLESQDQSVREGILDFYLSTMDYSAILFSMRVIKPLIDSLPPVDRINYIERIGELKKRDLKSSLTKSVTP